MMRINDWLPTLYHAAGGTSPLPSMDGMNQWDALVDNQESPRKLFLYNIDESRSIMGLRVGDWKLKSGHTYRGNYDDIYGPSGRGPLGPHLPYNISNVRDSLAAKCLAKIGMPLKSDKWLQQIRSESTLEGPPEGVKQALFLDTFSVVFRTLLHASTMSHMISDIHGYWQIFPLSEGMSSYRFVFLKNKSF